MNEQQKELERAVIGRGKYQLKQQYQYLQVAETKWFLMTPEQRKNHLSKLQLVALKSTIEEDALDLCPKPTEFTSPQVSTSTHCVDVSTAATLVNIPLTCLEGIWVKVKRLMETDRAIAPAPGQPSEARMVLSYSGKTPHMVTPKKNRLQL